jgi:hypothetical protein
MVDCNVQSREKKIKDTRVLGGKTWQDLALDAKTPISM